LEEEDALKTPGPVAPELAQTAAVDESRNDMAKDKAKRPSSPRRLMVTVVKSSHLTSTDSLLEAVKAKLEGPAGSCLPINLASKVRSIRLTIDKLGRVIGVKVFFVGGPSIPEDDSALKSCVQQALYHMSSSTVAKGADAGIIVISIELK